MSKPLSQPPIKTPFSTHREREFLYLSEVDDLIAATQNTRALTRNSALAILLFTQALQPTEISWLRWCDFDSTANVLQVVRNRRSTTSNQPQVVNRQKLCQAEVNTLIEL